jgi:hypothetical protein
MKVVVREAAVDVENVADLSVVIAGLDPAIHDEHQQAQR